MPSPNNSVTSTVFTLQLHIPPLSFGSLNAIRTFVYTSSCVCFPNDYLGQGVQCWLELAPNPMRQVLGAWIFQSVDLVQVSVVQLLKDRLKRSSNAGEIRYPACAGVQLAP